MYEERENRGQLVPLAVLGNPATAWVKPVCLDLWGSAEVEEVWRSSGRLLDEAAGLALLDQDNSCWETEEQTSINFNFDGKGR